jgi:regulator of RNase E activity RraA
MNRPTNYLSPEADAALRQVSTATLTSQLLKRGFRNTFLGNIKPIRPDLRMVGYAFTLRYIPMREDLDLQRVEYDNDTNIQRIVVEEIGPGDVLVIDARNDLEAATLGNILATRMKMRGAAGIVTDGGVRDYPAFVAIDIPTYTRGAHAALSSIRHHPADRNVPIGCGGVMVVPGDVVVGDAEGAVIIPAAIAEEVAADALLQEEMEEFVLKKIKSGASIRGVYPPDSATRQEFEQARLEARHESRPVTPRS